MNRGLRSELRVPSGALRADWPDQTLHPRRQPAFYDQAPLQLYNVTLSDGRRTASRTVPAHHPVGALATAISDTGIHRPARVVIERLDQEDEQA